MFKIIAMFALLLVFSSGCLSSAQIEKDYRRCVAVYKDDDCRQEREAAHENRRAGYWIVPVFFAGLVSVIVYGLHAENSK